MSVHLNSTSASDVLASLSLQDGENTKLADFEQGIQQVIDAFTPQARWQERAMVIVQLAKSLKEFQDSKELKKKLVPALQSALKDSKGFQAFASIRLISALYTFTPTFAHEILFKHDLLQLVMEVVLNKETQDSISLDILIVAELLCLSASHKDSRKALIGKVHDEVEQKEDAKVIEIKDGEGEPSELIEPVSWLISLVERTELENPVATSILSKASLLASLTLHKLTRVSAKGGDSGNLEQEGIQGLPKDKESEEAEQKKQAEEDAFLNEMCRRHLLLGIEAEMKSISDVSDFAIDPSLVKELARLCQLAAIEGLSYLSLQPVYRHSIANDTELLRSICSTAKGVTGRDGRTLFPSRGTENEKNFKDSPYDFDKLFDPQSSVGFRDAPNTAIQFGIASLLANIMSYPASKSKEEKQMEKLRRVANARNAEGNDEDDPFLSVDAIEERVRRVISVKGIEALVSIALSKAQSNLTGTGAKSEDVSVNQSAPVRQSVSSALLYGTTRQDKRQRGLIIQQGGAKALISIANVTVSQLLRRQELGKEGNDGDGSISFTAIQALAHLVITENPSLVSTDPIEMVPSLALLYLHYDSSRLQKFEASLALTNIASLSPQLANRIAHTGFQRRVLDTNAADAFVGADRGQDTSKKVNVSSILRDRIFLEENELSRRASLELLCNLLVVEDVFRRWSGEFDDDEQARKYSTSSSENKLQPKELGETKSARDLSFLIALCAPAGIDETSKESGLKLRLAAGGAVATLCSSASTCARILALEPRILNKICKLLDPKITLQQVDRIVELKGDMDHKEEADDDPEEEGRLNLEDVESDPLGPVHGQFQLALRGLTCIECILQYIDWIRGQGANDTTAYKCVMVESGVVEAVKSMAKIGASQLKANLASQQQQSGALQELQMQVTKQSLTLLKIVQQLGLLEN